MSYISDGGYYFLRTVPVTADNSSLYFIVNILDKYDKSEPDDNVIFSKEYSGYMNVSNTIDNVFDQDWMKFNSSKAGIYKIELNNVPSGAEYIVLLSKRKFYRCTKY